MRERDKKQANDLRAEWREVQICAEILRKQCGKISTCKNGEKYVEIGRTPNECKSQDFT